jgi:hypothetical protein
MAHPASYFISIEFLSWGQSSLGLELNKLQLNKYYLNAELNPIYHLLALLGAHHILHVSRLRIKPSQSGNSCYSSLFKTRHIGGSVFLANSFVSTGQGNKVFSVKVMKVYAGSRVIAPRILNLGIRWRLVEELQAQATLSPGKKLNTDKVGGWVGHRAGLNVSEKRKVS